MSKTGITLLGVSGSPRLKSTHYAVNEALEYARERHGVETDYFSVHRKAIGFCTHCDACIRKKQGCAFQDDAMERGVSRRCCARMPGSSAARLPGAGERPDEDGPGSLPRPGGPRRARLSQQGRGWASAIGGDRSGGQEPTLQSLIDFYHHQRDDPGGRRRVRRQPRRRRLVARQGRRGRQGRRRGHGAPCTASWTVWSR